MSTPTDATATSDPPSPSPLAGTLRSEQTIREVHTPEAAEILIAVRRLLVGKFGEKGPLQQLAEVIRGELKATDPNKKTRSIAQRLSEQLGARATKGPNWPNIADILRHCVPDDERATETERLKKLYQAARGQVPPAGSPAPTSISVDDEEVLSLRAAVCEANRERDQALQQAKQMADDLRTALRAAGNLTTRATEQEHELNEATHRINVLQAHLQMFQGRYEDSRNLNVVQQAELNEIREKFARMVAFIESHTDFRNARVATSALTSTALSTGVAPISTAPGPVRAVASYLRASAELGQHQIADIASATRLSPEVIERTFAAQDLPSYPVLTLIGNALGADSDYLRHAYMKATEATTALPPLTNDPALSTEATLFKDLCESRETLSAWEDLLSLAAPEPVGTNNQVIDEEPPTTPRAPQIPQQRTPRSRWLYRGRRRRE
jgi:hypothetical protein